MKIYKLVERKLSDAEKNTKELLYVSSNIDQVIEYMNNKIKVLTDLFEDAEVNDISHGPKIGRLVEFELNGYEVGISYHIRVDEVN